MDVETLPPTKNSRQEVKFINKRITNKNKKEGLTFDTVNDIYKGLLKKYNARDIQIKGMNMDGGFTGIINEDMKKKSNFTTVKGRVFTGNDLKYYDEEYLSSIPKETRSKIAGRYYYIDVIISV